MTGREWLRISGRIVAIMGMEFHLTYIEDVYIIFLLCYILTVLCPLAVIVFPVL